MAISAHLFLWGYCFVKLAKGSGQPSRVTTTVNSADAVNASANSETVNNTNNGVGNSANEILPANLNSVFNPNPSHPNANTNNNAPPAAATATENETDNAEAIFGASAGNTGENHNSNNNGFSAPFSGNSYRIAGIANTSNLNNTSSATANSTSASNNTTGGTHLSALSDRVSNILGGIGAGSSVENSAESIRERRLRFFLSGGGQGQTTEQ